MIQSSTIYYIKWALLILNLAPLYAWHSENKASSHCESVPPCSFIGRMPISSADAWPRRRMRHAVGDERTNGRFETREQHQLKKLLQRSETCILCCRNKFRLVRSLVFLQLAMKAERKKEKKS